MYEEKGECRRKRKLLRSLFSMVNLRKTAEGTATSRERGFRNRIG